MYTRELRCTQFDNTRMADGIIKFVYMFFFSFFPINLHTRLLIFKPSSEVKNNLIHMEHVLEKNSTEIEEIFQHKIVQINKF